MSYYGQTLAFTQMAELAGVTREQLEGWVAEELIPVIVTEPMFTGHNPPLRIDLQQVLLVRALRDGKTVEEGRKEVLANGRVSDTWKHTPPKKTDQDKTREQLDADRQEMWQRIKGGTSG